MTGLRRLLPAWLLLFTLLFPGLAAAAPQPISLAGYQAKLQQGIALLEAGDRQGAREHLSGSWQVETPDGPVEADLTGLAGLLARPEPSSQQQALAQAREHLAAAQALGRVQPAELEGARETLDAALREASTRSLLQWLREWWSRLLNRGTTAPLEKANTQTYYVAGVIALIALGFLGFQLYRTLARQSAPADASLQASRQGRPDRPLTPAERREEARRLSREGEHLAGIRLAHLALLQHYDAVKLIRYVEAQTNREHERQLRSRQPGLARGLRTLHDLVDDRLYSGHGATAEDFLRVDALVEQLWREGDAASRSAEATTGA